MTGLSEVNNASNSLSGNPCGCSESGCRRMRSTTLITRTAKSGSSPRTMSAAARVSSVGISPAQASTTSGSPSAGPGHPPDSQPAGAVQDRFLYGQVGQRRLLAGNDHIDVVTAAQAVVCHRQQRVAV